MVLAARKEGRRYPRRSVGDSSGICAWMDGQWQRMVVVQIGSRRGRDSKRESQSQLRPGIRPTLNVALRRRLRGFVELSVECHLEKRDSALDSYSLC